MRRALLALAAVALAVAPAACSRDGRELAEPGPDQTTTTPTTAPAGAGTATAPAMVLTSPQFADGARIPDTAACPTHESPALAWSGVPAGTVELAVVVTDPDAGDFVHWVVAGIDPGTTGLAAGAVPEGAVQAANDAGGNGWTGPCPPPGEAHTYLFRLLALAEPVGLAAGTDGRQAMAALTGALAEAQLRGTWSR